MRRHLRLFLVAVLVRAAVAAAAHAFSSPLNNYSYVVTPDRHLVFVNGGFMPAGGFYFAWVLFAAGGRTLAGFGVGFVLLGALIPLLVGRLATRLFPTIGRRHARLAAWLAVFFPPLVLLSASWRYMLAPVLLGLWSLDAILSERTAEGIAASSLLLLTRADYWVGTIAAALVLKTSWVKRGLIVGVPLAALALYQALAPAGVNGPHNFWYNLDAGTNADTRVAVVGYGPDRSTPEFTLHDFSQDEAVHRRNVFEFLRTRPRAFVEVTVMKIARLFDVHRDDALEQGPIENAIYTASVLATLLLALIGLGRMGPAAARPGLIVAVVWAVPMVLVFSLDRTRTLFQALWLMPAACALGTMYDAPDRPRPPAASREAAS